MAKFKPGTSGNPSGRRKQTVSQVELDAVKAAAQNIAELPKGMSVAEFLRSVLGIKTESLMKAIMERQPEVMRAFLDGRIDLLRWAQGRVIQVAKQNDNAGVRALELLFKSLGLASETTPSFQLAQFFGDGAKRLPFHEPMTAAQYADAVLEGERIRRAAAERTIDVQAGGGPAVVEFGDVAALPATVEGERAAEPVPVKKTNIEAMSPHEFFNPRPSPLRPVGPLAADAPCPSGGNREGLADPAAHSKIRHAQAALRREIDEMQEQRRKDSGNW